MVLVTPKQYEKAKRTGKEPKGSVWQCGNTSYGLRWRKWKRETAD
jgi:hypothetical protein